MINFCSAVLFVCHRMLFDNKLNPALEFQVPKEKLWLYGTNHTSVLSSTVVSHALKNINLFHTQ